MSASEKATNGIETLLEICGQVQTGEKVLVICDSKTKKIGELIAEFAVRKKYFVKLEVIKELSMHGAEPSQEIGAMMLESDLILGLTSFSMAHTQARLIASNLGKRYLSLPDYDLDVLESNALTAPCTFLSIQGI